MMTPAHIAYLILALTLVLVGVLHLGAPLLALLFSYFALSKLLLLTKRKWLTLALFILLAGGIAFCGGFFSLSAGGAVPRGGGAPNPPPPAPGVGRPRPPPLFLFCGVERHP